MLGTKVITKEELAAEGISYGSASKEAPGNGYAKGYDEGHMDGWDRGYNAGFIDATAGYEQS